MRNWRGIGKRFVKLRKSIYIAQLAWKNQLRVKYKEAQKTVDKKFRYFKRSFKKKDFEDLSNLSDSNQTEMWAKLKRLCDPHPAEQHWRF